MKFIILFIVACVLVVVGFVLILSKPSDTSSDTSDLEPIRMVQHGKATLTSTFVSEQDCIESGYKNCPDMNGDGVTDIVDISILMSNLDNQL